MAVVETVCPEKKQLFLKIGLSSPTEMLSQQIALKYLSIAIDECSDATVHVPDNVFLWHC